MISEEEYEAAQPAATDLPPLQQDPVAIALGFVDPPEQMSDELRERVDRIKRIGQAVRDQDALRQRFEEAMRSAPGLGLTVSGALDAVLAVRDEEMEALRRERDVLHRAVYGYEEHGHMPMGVLGSDEPARRPDCCPGCVWERAEKAEAEVEQLRYERRLLGAARRVLDLVAVGDLSRQEQARREAEDLAQRIVDEIGHPATDEPALGPGYRAAIARVRAIVDSLTNPSLQADFRAALDEQETDHA